MTKHIGIIGAGQMGQGIAQVFASHDFTVTLHDVNDEALKKAKSKLTETLNKLVEKNKIDANQAKSTLSRITYSGDFKDCNLVIEAAIENFEIKTQIFKHIESQVSSDCIIATNTSSISINKLADNLDKPARFLGIHFMNPAPIMPLIEVIKGKQTSDSTMKTALDLINTIGKQPVISADSPGFIVNRILIPMLNESIILLHDKVASAEDIDKAMMLGAGFPMGPLKLADFIGLDTCLAIMEVLHKELKSDKYKPSELLRKYVKDGKLGKKSGHGFYDY